jgi:hypothetical protein
VQQARQKIGNLDVVDAPPAIIRIEDEDLD